MFQTSYRNKPVASYITLLFISLALLLLIFGTENFVSQRSEHSVNEQRQTIQKFAVQCYASEGSYPPDLKYLEDNYALILNKEKYTYIYSVFASNIMPDIIVIPKLEKKPGPLNKGEQ